MSVILDALHKARGEKKTDPQSKSMARVLETQRAGGVSTARPVSRMWIPAMIIFSGLLLLCLVAGVLYFLFARLGQIEARDSRPATTQVIIPTPAAPVAAPLPTPLPLQELPVQGPVAASAPEQPFDPKKEFTLGSIVCENHDCLALINGRTMKTGATIKGYKVKSIDSSSVTLESPSGDSVTLSLF